MFDFDKRHWIFRHKVFPCVSRQDAMYVRRSYIEPCAKFSLSQSLRQMQTPNFFYLIFCQLCRSRVLSVRVFRMVVSMFFNHIPHVVHLGSKKKVLWIDTFGIVAFVTNLVHVWINACFYHPGDSMSQIQFISKTNLSITRLRDIASPSPTIISRRFVDFLPKTFNLNLGQYRKFCDFHGVSILSHYFKNV